MLQKTVPSSRYVPPRSTINNICPICDGREWQTKHDLGNFSIDDAVRCQHIQQITFFLDRADFIGQTCAIGAFDDFGEIFYDVAVSALPFLNLSLQI